MRWKGYFFGIIFFLGIFLINAQTTGESINGEAITGKNTRNFALQIVVGPPLPLVYIYSPESIEYTFGQNILLNYSTINADNVWFNLNDGNNVTLSGLIYINPSVGSYKLQIFVNNSYGLNNSANVSFAVQEGEVTPPGGGGGGGGGGGCTPKEDCGSWSACLNGNRTRTCVDLNKCIPDKVEKISCIDQIASNCSLKFNNGWNFISLCAQLDNYTVEEVLRPIEGNYEYLLEWDDYSQEFNLWAKRGQKDFTKFNYLKSYFVFYQGDEENVNLSGEQFDSLDIPLLRGWESPLYPYDFESIIIGNKFYSAEFNYMLDWDKKDQEFLVHSPQMEEKQFNKIMPGKGYFINTNATIIRYRK